MAKNKSNAKSKAASAKAKARYNALNIKNRKNSKNTVYYKNARNEGANNKTVSKKVYWISIASCVVVAIAIILIIVFVGGNKGNNQNTSADSSANSAANNAANSSANSAANAGADGSADDYADSYSVTSATNPIDNPINQFDPNAFYYSEGIAENGFWIDTTARDYIEPFNYRAFPIPKENHEVSNGDLWAEIYNIVDSLYFETRQITDRAVVDGDKVNVDFVGSVDGIEFDGGSTFGEGTDVTAGSTNYIDDFLTQLIGHKPGETVDVNVTFPEDYGQDNLNGKDAVFVTRINYISEYDITDSYISENFNEDYGWTTVDDMKGEIKEGLERSKIGNYVNDYLSYRVSLSAIPENISSFLEKRITYEEAEMLAYYQDYADENGMDMDTFLQTYMGLSDVNELIVQNRNSLTGEAKRSLVVQAVAEDAGISITADDIAYYMPDYMSYVDQYGIPWLAQYTLGDKVIDYIIENAVLT